MREYSSVIDSIPPSRLDKSVQDWRELQYSSVIDSIPPSPP